MTNRGGSWLSPKLAPQAMLIFIWISLLTSLVTARGKAARREYTDLGDYQGATRKKARTARGAVPVPDYTLPIPADYARYQNIVNVPAQRQYSGFTNPRNVTCYMAALLQVFFHYKPLRTAILAMPVDRNSLLYGLQQVMHD